MQKLYKYLLLFSVPLVTLWIAAFIYDRVTDGFNVRRITSSFSSHFFCQPLPLAEKDKEGIRAALDQPFSYIGKGCQFYVFESLDRKYVLKFFKQKHLRPHLWLQVLPAPMILKKKIESRSRRIESLFNSCNIAYEQLREESGLLFTHLDHSPLLEKNVTLIDKLGMPHPIFLDDFEYLLQKKGISVEEVFSKIDEKQAAVKIEAIVDLIIARIKKGVGDRDKAVAQNLAFTSDEKPLFIDVGQFFKEEKIRSEDEIRSEIVDRLRNFRVWVTRNHPSLSDYVDRKIERLNLNEN